MRLRHQLLRAAFAALLLVSFGCTDDESGDPTETTVTGPGGGSATSPVEIPPLTEPQFRLALELKNKGVAALENLDFAEADRRFSQLRELLPNAQLPIRNLAITRVLSVIDRSSPYSRSKDPDAYQSAVRDAEAAIESFRLLVEDQEDAAIADLLLGKLAAHDDSAATPRIDEAIRLLTKAAESRETPEFWFAVAAAMDEHNQMNRSIELLQTLKKCRELAPDNLFVVAKLADVMALGLNSPDEDVRAFCQTLPEQLESSLPLLTPLKSAIEQQTGIDVVAMIQEATESDEPTASVAPAMMVKNLVVAELAGQIDRRRIDRNLLEYVWHEFPELPPLAAGVESALYPPQSDSVVSGFKPVDGLPSLTGVTQCAFADMDLDGNDDLLVAREGALEIYRREAEGESGWNLLCSFSDAEHPVQQFLLLDMDRDFDRALSDVKAPALLSDPDGDRKIPTDPAGKNRWYDTSLDVVMWGDDGVIIAQNKPDENGGRTLTAIPSQITVMNVNAAVGADIEADGDLDLVFATTEGLSLWRNIDGNSFGEWDASLQLPDYAISDVIAADWNRDMAMDIVGVATDGRVGVLENILHGRMRWLEITDDASQSAAEIIIGDYNRDAQWDAVTSGSSLRMASASKDDIREISDAAGQQITQADLDNDGCPDLIVAGGASGELHILRGSPDGQFRPLAVDLPDQIRSTEPVDFDDDGDLDLVTVTSEDGSLSLLLNEGGNQNNWIKVVTRAVPNDPQFPANRVNMHGVGAVVEVRAGGDYQAHIVERPRLHLGLGQAESLDAVRVTWTDGVPQNVVAPKLLRSNVGILAPQILLGSCPYIYTWTGERFEFFSDCLWAAPIGLVQASGDLAPTREWENLFIPGDRLVEKDGRLVLQLTEELWETAYFDEVRLTAIDHPADLQVLTNEKVGSPEMAAHRLHTFRSPIPPDSVTDKHGRDLTSDLLHQDGNYVQPFDGRILQGLTDEWTMEFTCELDSAPESLRLVLVGWVFPTDTSLNLGIHQNPALAPPSGPAIEVLDSEGSWQTAIPYIGFPGGKTKAIVVDLTELDFPPSVRFRIRSSMELYFDRAWFIVDESDETVITQECPLESADLHYRGFSHRVYASNALFRNGFAPESYDYDAVRTEMLWSPVNGRFTRYGSVDPLLTSLDDHLVVMGPGDELTVEFAAPDAPLPEGWVRDFVLYNVGWDKDANLNTVYGQSSEPYPFAAMSRYPFSMDENLPEETAYQQYLETWQTREYRPDELSGALLPEPRK